MQNQSTGITGWRSRLDAKDIRNSLAFHEAEIIKGMKSIGANLREIRDDKLYRHDYSTFEEYCRKKWNMSISRAYKLMDADEVRSALSDGPEEIKRLAESMPESQLRELVPIPKEELMKVAKKVAKKAKEGPLTAAAVRLIARPDILPPKTQCCPHCHQPLPRIKRKAEIPD